VSSLNKTRSTGAGTGIAFDAINRDAGRALVQIWFLLVGLGAFYLTKGCLQEQNVSTREK
jgi:hypothetical protein